MRHVVWYRGILVHGNAFVTLLIVIGGRDDVWLICCILLCVVLCNVLRGHLQHVVCYGLRMHREGAILTIEVFVLDTTVNESEIKS